MKNIYILFALLLFNISVFSQSPEGIIYQAEARDNAGEVIANESLEVQISIFQGNINGELVWQGFHQVITNDYGMFTLVIGTGSNNTGDLFEDINWGDDTHFLNVKVKKPNNTTWVDMGTSQFLSVPYALYAKTAGSVAESPEMIQKNAKIGIPSQSWSLFGNLNSDPTKDKLGTTDHTDLVFVTDNVERLRITADGQLITAPEVGLELGGNLQVHGDRVDVDKDLYVGRNVYLNQNDAFTPLGETFNYGNFSVDGVTKLNNSLFVTGPTQIDQTLHTLGDVQFEGKLAVEGSVKMNNTLNVLGETVLQNKLNVSGIGNFNAALNVDGFFSVKSNKFTVDNTNGNTNIAGNLNVVGMGQLSNLTVSGNGTTKGEHVALFENTEGGEGDGIAIKINNATTTEENNFITFYRNTAVAGRIEGYHHQLGQKPAIIAELIEPMLSSSSSFFTNTLGFETPIDLNLNFISFSRGSLPSLSGGSLPSASFSWTDGLDFSKGSFPTLNTGSLPSMSFEFPISFNSGVTELIQPWTWFKPDWGGIVSNQNNPVYKLFVEAYENDWKSLTDMGITELVIKAAEMELEANIKSEGITYGSKGADYAEWLPRLNKEDKLTIGQIVGVHGGEISLQTENADQILVVSSKPIILGNMPEEGKEELSEKVAFMGQVPTWVKGNVNVGDYILASGKNDGTGIAVAPENVTLEDIPLIVGKAWSKSSNSLLSLINVAIGLNRNDISKVVISQQKQIMELEVRLNKMEENINHMSSIYTENK